MYLRAKRYFVILSSLLSVGCCATAGPIAGGTVAAPADDTAALQELSKLVLLESSDATQYSSDLQNLVGSYYQLVPTTDNRFVLQLLGRASEDMKIDKIELKDKVRFKKVTDNNYSGGVTIPWLNLQAKNDERLDTLIQDIASVSAPSSAQFIGSHLPPATSLDPALPVYYASGATVTLISQKSYTANSVNGSIPIINVGGQAAYMKDIIANGWMVSVSKILARRPTSGPKSAFSVLAGKLYEEDTTVQGMVVSVKPPRSK